MSCSFPWGFFCFFLVVLCLPDSNISTPSHGCFVEERTALMDIGSSLTRSNGTAPRSWGRGDDCCLWEHVKCSNITGRVSHLYFSNLYASDEVLDAHGHSFWRFDTTVFSSFPELQFLDLSMNNATFQSWDGLTKLRYLKLNNNCLDGTIPASIGKLVSLEVLHLQFTGVDGVLPSSVFESFRNLRELDLSSNRLNGSIPSSLFSLPRLEHLSLSQNLFEGSIPVTPSSNITSALKTFNFSMNNLSGEFSFFWLRNLTKLQKIDVSGNANLVVAVNFPSWSPSFQLKVLVLSGCNLDKNIVREPIFLRTQHQLEVLDLSNNSLSGSMPNWLFTEQTTLVYLNLGNNSLTGSLGPIWYPQMNLQAISLPMNRISGHLPANISSVFPNMSFLDVSSNTISGEIPSSLCNITRMEYLDLSNNSLSGELPNCLLTEYPILTTLKVSNNKLGGPIFGGTNHLSIKHALYLDGNKFEGTLPRYLTADFDAHGTLDLHDNNLSVPFSFFNSSTVMALDLSHNQFNGNIEWVQYLGEIKYLSLGSNKFEGQISPSLCQLQSLRILDFSHNSLSGPLPSCIGNLSFGQNPVGIPLWSLICENHFRYPIFDYIGCYEDRGFSFRTKGNIYIYKHNFINWMSGIDLSANMLSGQIPRELGNLGHIKALNLSHNFFDGPIPATFANMSSIESLDLSHNKLSGAIPWQLTRLSSLSVFSVMYNNLSGCIPDSGQFGSFDMDSYQGNNLLHPASEGSECAPSSGHSLPDDGGEKANDPILYAVTAASFVVTFWITFTFTSFRMPPS
uniref:non-specific serine/threonine protein kinase n=1 Tax=Oryza barthii TaxID=65489 RepID=A0A0D3G0X3_9ORYZ